MPASPEWCLKKDREATTLGTKAEAHDARAEELWIESGESWEKYQEYVEEVEEIETAQENVSKLESEQARLEGELSTTDEAKAAAEDALQEAEDDEAEKLELYELTWAEWMATYDELEIVLDNLDEASGYLDDLFADDPDYDFWLQRFDELDIRRVDLEVELEIIETHLLEYDADLQAAEILVEEKQRALERAISEYERIEDEKKIIDAELAEFDAMRSLSEAKNDRDTWEFNALAREADAEAEEILAGQAWDDFDVLVTELETHCDYDY
jgi:predicted  nucleic acid-binding Zn-ribbon protein